MNIPPDKYKKLIAVNKKRQIVSIPNRVMRKQRWAEEQNKKLTPNSICIVCNFSYYGKDRGWSDKVRAICHPFREYQQPVGGRKLHLFSESDFCDTLWMDDIALLKNSDSYEYDFFCFTIDSSQGVKCKGSHSLSLIFEVAKELEMKGMVLDYYPKFPRPACDNGGKWDNQVLEVRSALSKMDNITIKRGWFDQRKINKLMNKCKFVIFPNTRDASPRTIPETLLRGKPVMINKNILGGWKYSNDVNGISYDGPFDMEDIKNNKKYYYNEIKSSLSYMGSNKFNAISIKNDYLEKYGFVNSAKRLAKIINRIEGHKKYRYVAYTDFRKYLQAII